MHMNYIVYTLYVHTCTCVHTVYMHSACCYMQMYMYMYMYVLHELLDTCDFYNLLSLQSLIEALSSLSRSSS